MTPRERLMEILIGRSVRLGDFTLASGAKSSYYVDARRTTMSAEGQHLTGAVCWDALQASGLEPTHVGGLTMGADPVTYALARESFERGHPLDGFSVRKKAKEHGTGQRIEGGLPEGARCLVIEDSMTTGGSALKAIEALQDFDRTRVIAQGRTVPVTASAGAVGSSARAIGFTERCGDRKVLNA